MMASRTVSTLKFVGSISLGLLTGLSYSLSSLTIPTLLDLPSATGASRAFANLTSSSVLQLRTLASVSASSFFLAYLLSPRSQKHPYLLWTTLFVTASVFTDTVLPYVVSKPSAVPRVVKTKDRKGKGRQMDASYEVLGHDSNSEGTMSGEELEEEVNGEEVRQQMEGFKMSQMIRTAVAGLGFAMSVVGIWGDGAADVVIVEM
ncbi:Autophagy-related 33 [Hyphodiscus hymeniophilus]|uniref:Autophagy-related 33 n=1 Tax=Hyphodiscus hymeniophilus TaxID=353542 RepID=A0A9P6VN90_9HELO|nr:Autophagy-related 33 [Hyphodiscus hymeniophilus]